MSIQIGKRDDELPSNLSEVRFCAFALSDCVVQLKPESAKYLRAVHRTALELAVPNLFGAEMGGYWLKPDQINQLRKLPECYPATEVAFVRDAIEAFLLAQTEDIQLTGIFHHLETFTITNHSLMKQP
jgi:hypothetical protein